MLRGYASGCASGVCFARAPPSTNTYLGPRKKILTHIYTLQIQNRSFSRVCSNTRGLHTKPEVFENLIIFEVWLLFWIPCWIKSACWCVFSWQNSPFLHVRHSWPWAGWHNHACYPIHFPKGYVFSADAPSQITFKPLKIQWNLNHLNPYKKYGLVRV